MYEACSDISRSVIVLDEGVEEVSNMIVPTGLEAGVPFTCQLVAPT
jgi:hypothetical protein